MHALIVGDRGVGKSTLIRRILQALDRPVFGFETKKEACSHAEQPGKPIYIYEAGQPHVQTEENLAGYCDQQLLEVRTEVFDRFAPKLHGPFPHGSLILLDELGVMEASSQSFCDAVLSLLDGAAPVIAAVKHKNTPFLERVRSHPNCRCFYITEENRDVLYGEVLSFIQDQLPAAP